MSTVYRFNFCLAIFDAISAITGSIFDAIDLIAVVEFAPLILPIESTGGETEYQGIPLAPYPH